MWIAKCLEGQDMPKEHRGKWWGQWGRPTDKAVIQELARANLGGKSWADGRGRLHEKNYGMAPITYFIWSDEPEKNEWGEVCP